MSYIEALEKRFLELKRLCIDIFQIDISDIKLSINLKGKAAGKYYPSKREIHLNRYLLATHPFDMLNKILIHEIAHHIAYLLHGKKIKPHGTEWKNICKKLGYEPEVYHNLPVQKSRELRRFKYRCGCSNHLITSIRHNRIQKGIAYFCKKCKKRLEISN